MCLGAGRVSPTSAMPPFRCCAEGQKGTSQLARRSLLGLSTAKKEHKYTISEVGQAAQCILVKG